MSEDVTNDNAGLDGVSHEPDPHGQAAMLLVESLIHGLVAKQIITVADAVEIVDIAAEVKANIAGELGDSPATLQKSLQLLKSISDSLAGDLPR